MTPEEIAEQVEWLDETIKADILKHLASTEKVPWNNGAWFKMFEKPKEKEVMAELKPFNTEIDRIKAKIEADLRARLNGPKIAYTREGVDELTKVIQNSFNQMQNAGLLSPYTQHVPSGLSINNKEIEMNTKSTPRKNKFQPGDLVRHTRKGFQKATRTVISTDEDGFITYQNSLDPPGTYDDAHETALELDVPETPATTAPEPFATYGFYDDSPDVDRIFEENPGAQVIEVNGKIWVHRDRAEYIKKHFGLVWVENGHGTPGAEHCPVGVLTVEDILDALRSRTHFTVKAYK